MERNDCVLNLSAGESKVAAEKYSNALREALFPYLNLD